MRGGAGGGQEYVYASQQAASERKGRHQISEGYKIIGEREGRVTRQWKMIPESKEEGTALPKDLRGNIKIKRPVYKLKKKKERVEIDRARKLARQGERGLDFPSSKMKGTKYGEKYATQERKIRPKRGLQKKVKSRETRRRQPIFQITRFYTKKTT